MVSREHKGLHLLRSITNSHSEIETSIIKDASNYIKKLKQKVEKLNNATSTTTQQSFYNSTDPNPLVAVETLKKGFMIKVMSRKNETGMLVCVLETFDDLGLDLVEANISCTDTFSFHAIGSSYNDEGDSMDAETVKQTVEEAIRKWSDPKC